MSPLSWARPEITCTFPGAIPSPTDSSAGILHIHSLQAQFLFPMDPNGKSDPFVQVFVNDELKPREQTKVNRKTLFPDWTPDWKLYASQILIIFICNGESFSLDVTF